MKAPIRLFSRSLLLCGLFPLLTGCALSPLATRTAAFSTAATATINQTNSAYELVNQTYFDTQVALLVANYNRSGFDPSKIKPFLPPADLAVRAQVLQGLQQYATLLAEVSGNQPITDLETQAKATGSSLKTLQTDSFTSFKRNGTGLNDQEKNLAVTAVSALGSILIEHERSRALPGILDKMNDPIQKICTILESDLGTADKPGLAAELHQNYDEQIVVQQKFIADNAATLTPEERRTEIATLPKLVQAQQQGDQALAATVKALTSLAAAHAALAGTKTQKDAPAFKLELTQMAQDAQTLNSFYTSLKSK